MIKIKKFKTLFVILSLILVSSAQVSVCQNVKAKKATIVYNSVVKDKEGNPVKFANIYGNQGAVVAKSDENGEFSISVNFDTEILIESEGYSPVTINSLTKLPEIVLNRNEFLLGENDKISSSFRSVLKGNLVGNIATIKVPEVLKHDNLNNFQMLLDSYGAGMKGGFNLLGLGDALIIVDGLPRDASTLLPEEIEDISILKDVNSAMLYGSQAKNGVILVKTKRGIANKRIINMSIEQGINTPVVLPKYLNSKEYMTLYNEAQLNDNPDKAPDYNEIAYYDGSNPYRYSDVNYYGDEFLKSSFNSTRFMSEFRGGNNIATYYANIGMEHFDVLYKANNGQSNGTNRLRARGNVDFKINDHFKSYIDAAFVFNTSTGLRTDFFSMASSFRPNDYTPLLSTNLFENPELIEDLIKVKGENILGGNSLVSKNSYGKNVYGEFNLAGYSKTFNNRMLFNTGINYDLVQILKGLSAKANVSFDTYGSYSESIQNTYALYEPIWNDATGKISGVKTINSDSKTGVLTLSSGALQRTIGANVSIDYDRVFNKKHHVTSTLLGFFSTESILNTIYANKNSHLGLNASYEYNNCYLVDFSGAVINSVKLAPGHRLSFSPSLGLGWVVSNANFWKLNNTVNFLKIKATGGILKTDASDYFGYNRFREIYSVGSGFGTGDVGGYNFTSTYVSQIANPNLKMEEMRNINAGVEAAFLNKSLFIEVNYFVNRYANQITQRLNFYPGIISTFIPYENYNETEYSGIDFSLKYQKTINKLKISTGLNVLYSKSEFIKRDEIHNNDYQYLVGKPTDTYWGLKSLGFFSTDAEAIAARQSFGTIRRGDIKYEDLDGNGFIDDNDKTAIGNSSPRIMSDLNFSLGYKGFTLFVNMSSRLGYDWMMSTTETPNNYFWVDGSKKYSEIVLNRWTDQTAATATYPRLTAQTSQNNFRTSDFWKVNGNELTLSRVQLSYDLPTQMFKNTFIKGISAYMRGNNLLMLAEKAMLRQTSIYVSTRNFSLGFKISY